MVKDVCRCTRRYNEPYRIFANRFMSKALLVLNHMEVPDSHGDSKTFSMILLYNARPPVSFYNAIITVVVWDAVQNH